MRLFLGTLVLTFCSTDVCAQAADPEPMGMLIDKLQREAVAIDEHPQEVLARAMHQAAFGTDAPRADVDLRRAHEWSTCLQDPEIESATFTRHTEALAALIDLDLGHLPQSHRDHIAQRRRSLEPSLGDAFDLTMMWRHLPPGPVKARWWTIVREYQGDVHFGSTVSWSPEDTTREMLARFWHSHRTPFGTWRSLMGNERQRREALRHLLAGNRFSTHRTAQDLILDLLRLRDLRDAGIVRLLIATSPDTRLMRGILALLKNTELPDPALATAFASEDHLVALLVAATCTQRSPEIQRVVDRLLKPLPAGNWSWFPDDWRDVFVDTQQDDPKALMFEGDWLWWWSSLPQSGRDTAERRIAEALPRLPAVRAAALTAMLGRLVTWDGPLMQAGANHPRPEVRYLVRQHQLWQEPNQERLDDWIKAWNAMPLRARLQASDWWVGSLAASASIWRAGGEETATATAIAGTAEFLAATVDTASADHAYPPDAIAAGQRLLHDLGRPLDMVRLLDRAHDDLHDKGWRLVRLLRTVHRAGQIDAPALMATAADWRLEMRLLAMAFTGDFERALDIWRQERPDEDVPRTLSSLGWGLAPELMVQRSPKSRLATLGWGFEAHATPPPTPADLDDFHDRMRFHAGCYRRFTDLPHADIPWWLWSEVHRAPDVIMELGRQERLTREDLRQWMQTIQEGRRNASLTTTRKVPGLVRHLSQWETFDDAERYPFALLPLALEARFQDGAWQKVLDLYDELPAHRRQHLRAVIARERLGRLREDQRAAWLSQLSHVQRFHAARWYRNQGWIGAAVQAARSVDIRHFDRWRLFRWHTWSLRLALATGDLDHARRHHRLAHCNRSDEVEESFLDAIAPLLELEHEDAAMIKAWAGAPMDADLSDDLERLQHWRTQAQSEHWRRWVSWLTASAHHAAGQERQALAIWEELSDGSDWWARISRRCSAANGTASRLVCLPGWYTKTPVAERIAATEPGLRLALNPETGRPVAMLAAMIWCDPAGVPNLLYDRDIEGPWDGWTLYLSDYSPMVQPGPWLGVGRVDGKEEVLSVIMQDLAPE